MLGMPLGLVEIIWITTEVSLVLLQLACLLEIDMEKVAL